MLHSDNHRVYNNPSYPQALLSQQVLASNLPNHSFFSNEIPRFYSSSNVIQPRQLFNHFLPSYDPMQTHVQTNPYVMVPRSRPTLHHPSAPTMTNLRLHNSAKSCSFPAPRPKTSTKTILELLECPTAQERKKRTAHGFNSKPNHYYQKRHSHQRTSSYVRPVPRSISFV